MFKFVQPDCGFSKVLIKKSYDRTRRVKRRNWKLQEMARDRDGMDTDDERYNRSSLYHFSELTEIKLQNFFFLSDSHPVIFLSAVQY